MLKPIKELFKLLTPSQKKRFYILQLFVVIMAILELIGIASITPFMAIVSDPNLMESKPLFKQLYNFSGTTSYRDFLFFIGLLVLATLTITALISMFTMWQLSLFSARVGTEIADRLYKYYINQDLLFHVGGSSSELIKKVSTEADRISERVIQPLMQMNAKIVLVLIIFSAIILINSFVAVSGLLIFGTAYFLIFNIFRERLKKNGHNFSVSMVDRFRLMNDGFGGIKEILLLGCKDNFINRFERTSKIIAHARGSNAAITQVPRYFMELIAFGSIIGLVLYMLNSRAQNLSTVLPLLTFYAFAGYKLLPAFQQIYSSFALVKGNIASFEAIREDLMLSQVKASGTSHPSSWMKEYFPLKNNIQLQDIIFTYPGKSKPTLNKLTMNIQADSVVGIAGVSGSGKSTLIDILLGLIQPQIGQFKIDGEIISNQNRRAWQNTIGFVPQSIFLSESTIAENIAFGIPHDQIDHEEVNKVLTLACLNELVQSLEQGIHTKVGERGVQLSGGQRQRIGVARALYHKPDVLIFDEATSALDGVTEHIMMEAIHLFRGQKTIVMVAHRLKTLQKCDQIFFINNGQVSDTGTYQELISKNKYFRRMAEHS